MRLFVAILLDGPVRSALARFADTLRSTCDGFRWVSADRLHLTLKFLGEVPDRRVPQVTDAVAQSAKEAAPFDMTLAGCGCFPAAGPARVIWVRVQEASGALLHCAETVESGLEPLGFARERRPYSAHITLGRGRHGRAEGEARAIVDGHTFGPLEQSVSSITLMSSVLSRRGPTYTPVCTAKLGAVKGC